MDISLFARGFLLGFSIAAVVGPIALLCVRRTLATGFVIGFASGLGAATADASYAAIASFGVTALASVLIDQRMWLRLVGGAFLIYLGVRALRSLPASPAPDSGATGLRLAGAYSSTVGLTLSNPMTIMSFAAIFAGIGASGLDLVVGVFAGSAAWWLVLASLVSRLRTRVTHRRLRWVNIASGALIVGFGIESVVAGVLQTN
ncbi:MAG: LysE family transporter [Chloroflexi bacterium]|nr:LysE family transporter [Chloroflexota bacterium]MBV9602161.1 LysE family transporter [Chloroflexota bacterium]